MVLEFGLAGDLDFKPFICNLHICLPHSVYLLICCSLSMFRSLHVDMKKHVRDNLQFFVRVCSLPEGRSLHLRDNI